MWYATDIMSVTEIQPKMQTPPEKKQRVGILTYHSQLNYGGVLQAFALQTVLHHLGVRVKTIDFWMAPKNVKLIGLLVLPFGQAIILLLASLLSLCGRGMDSVRRLRTWRFIHKHLALTDYHLESWKEMEGRDLGLDCIVVGSDQVWGPREDNYYFLEGAPKTIPAISYAASFGDRCIQDKLEPNYGALLDHFSAISVREAKGVQLVASVGHQATHVLDPTQLLSAARWREVLALPERSEKPVLVCYFMCMFCSDWLLERLPALRAFAKRTGYQVEILVDNPTNRLPRSFADARQKGSQALRYILRSRGLTVRRGAGPREFMKAFAGATCVISNSFHALQFASIFGLNARIIRSSEKDRSAMFERFTDFQAKYVQGPLFADDVGDALASLERGETVSYDEAALAADRERSLTWLREALAQATGEVAND